MFFMGGMTLGYLHPPASAKLSESAGTSSAEEKNIRSSGLPTGPTQGEGTMERTLLWARRILC